jgi:peptide/nickel transport system substrate-binding protein
MVSMAPKLRGRPARLLLPAVLALAFFTGCGEDKPAQPPAQAAASPHRGGTIVTGWGAEPSGLNEYTTPSTNTTNEVLFLVFQHLLEEQPDFFSGPPALTPQLAESYEWSDDHRVLTFHLRKGLLWSDGVPLTSEDVRWTWQAQRDPGVAWDSAFMKDEITDVEAVDPQTVRFHFRRAYAKQLQDANEGVILPHHVWSRIPFSKWRESADWFKQNMVAAGPFKIHSWTPQQELVLVRNERYFEKDRPYLDRVVMRFVPDPSAMMTQILNGELDFVLQVAPSDAPRILDAPHLRLVPFSSNLSVVVAWNLKDPLFSDPEVRRALTLALDRQTIVDTILKGYGRVGASPIVSDVWAHDRALKPLPFDLAEARRILAAKGWRDSDGDGVLDRNGKPFAFEITTNTNNQQRADALVMIQDQLKKVGVKAMPRILEFNTLIAQTNSGDYQASVAGFVMDTSLDLTGNYHSRAFPPNGSNFMLYVNPEADRLMDVVAAAPDLRAVLPQIHALERIIVRDQPVTFLWESQRLAVVSKRVHDAKPNQARGFFNLKDWWAEPRP